jgi:hypothetical protein
MRPYFSFAILSRWFPLHETRILTTYVWLRCGYFLLSNHLRYLIFDFKNIIALKILFLSRWIIWMLYWIYLILAYCIFIRFRERWFDNILFQRFRILDYIHYNVLLFFRRSISCHTLIRIWTIVVLIDWLRLRRGDAVVILVLRTYLIDFLFSLV